MEREQSRVPFNPHPKRKFILTRLRDVCLHICRRKFRYWRTWEAFPSSFAPFFSTYSLFSKRKKERKRERANEPPRLGNGHRTFTQIPLFPSLYTIIVPCSIIKRSNHDSKWNENWANCIVIFYVSFTISRQSRWNGNTRSKRDNTKSIWEKAR